MSEEKAGDFFELVEIVNSGDSFPDFHLELDDSPESAQLKVFNFMLGVPVAALHPESIMPDGKVVGRVKYKEQTYLVTWHRGSILIQSEQTGLMARFSILMLLGSLLGQAGKSIKGNYIPDIDDPDELGA